MTTEIFVWKAFLEHILGVCFIANRCYVFDTVIQLDSENAICKPPKKGSRH